MGDRAQNPSSSNFQSINPNDPRFQGAVQRPAPGNISQYPLPPYSPVSMMNPLYPYGTSFLNFPVPTQPGTTFETFQFQGPQSYRVAPQPHGQSINPGISFQQQQPCGPPNPPPMITRLPPPNVGRQDATSSTSRPPPSTTSKNLTTTGQISPSGAPSSCPASGDHDSTRSASDLNPVNLTPQASTSTANNHATAPSSPRLPPESGEARPLHNTNTAPQHLSFTPNVSVTCGLGTPSGSSTFVMPDRLPSPPGWKSNPFRDAEEAHAAWGEIAERNDRSISLKTRLADPLHSQIVGTFELPANKGETSVGTSLGGSSPPRVQNDTPNVAMAHSTPQDIEKPTRSENEGPKLEVRAPTPKSQYSTLPNTGSGSRHPTPNPIVESNNMINLPRRSQSVCDGSTEIGDRAPEQKSELGSWTSLLPNVKVMPSPTRHRILYQGYKEEIEGQVKEEVKDEEYLDGLVGPARGSATVTPMKRSPSLHDLWVEGEQERSTTGECHPTKRRRLDEVSGAPGDESKNLSGNETLLLHPTARGHSNPTISQGTTEAHDPAETPTTALGSTSSVVLTNPPAHVSPQGIVVSPYAKIPFTSFSSSRRPLSGDTSTQNNRKRTASADADHVDSGQKRARIDSPGPDLYSSNAVDEQGISAMMPTQGYCSHPPNDHVVKATTTDTHATPPSSPLQGDSRGVGTDAPHTPHPPSPIHDSASVPQPAECDNSEVLPACLSPQPPIEREPQGPSFSDTPNPKTSPAADARRKSDYSPQSKRNRMDRRRQANTNSGAMDQQGVQGRSGALNSTLQRKQPNGHSARVPEGPYARLGGSVDSDSTHRGAEQRAARPYPWKFGDNHWHPPDEDEDPRNGRTSSPSPVSRTQRRNVDGWGPSEGSRSRSPNYHNPRHENQWSPRRDWEHPRPRSPPLRRYPDDLRTYRTGGDSYRPPPSAHTTIRLTPPPPPYEPFQHIRDRGQPYSPYDSGSGSHFQALPLGPASPTNTSFQRTTSPGGTVWAILPRSPPDPHGGEHKFRGGPTGASSLSGTGPESGGTNPAGTLSGSTVSTALEVPRSLVGRAYNNTDRPHWPSAGAAQSNEKMTADVRSPYVQPNTSQPSDTAPDPVSRPLHSDTSFVDPSGRRVVSSGKDDTGPASSRPLVARLSSTGPERATCDAAEEPRPSLLSRVDVSSPTEGNHVPIARGRTRGGPPPPPRSSLRDRIHTEPTNSDRGRLAERVNPLAPYYGAVGSRTSDSDGTPMFQSTHLLNRLEAPRPGRGSSYRGNRARGRGRGVWNREA